MIPVESIINRFENLRLVQKQLQQEEIKTAFTETDIKTIIYYLSDYKAIKDCYEADAACLNPEKLNEVKQDFKQDLNKDDEMFGDYMSPIV